MELGETWRLMTPRDVDNTTIDLAYFFTLETVGKRRFYVKHYHDFFRPKLHGLRYFSKNGGIQWDMKCVAFINKQEMWRQSEAMNLIQKTAPKSNYNGPFTSPPCMLTSSYAGGCISDVSAYRDSQHDPQWAPGELKRIWNDLTSWAFYYQLRQIYLRVCSPANCESLGAAK